MRLHNSINITRPIIVFFFILLPIFLSAEVKAIWVTPWELDSTDKIDKLIMDCQEHSINQILAEVRYRADALYTPNRFNKNYQNPERKSYLLADNFDPLAYLIEKTRNTDIEVIAWFTCFVVTSHTLANMPYDHVYYQHPEWITVNQAQKMMRPNETEGAFLDPGIPEVRQYLLRVILDVVSNYDIDGVQLDYIRYPGKEFGYNPIARQQFFAEYPVESQLLWQTWKEQQVAETVRSIHNEIKKIKPQVQLSAAVIANQLTARNRFSQNWLEWIQNNWIDKVYLMAYQTKDDEFMKIMNDIPSSEQEKVVVGLRAWTENSVYPAEKIISKIRGLSDYRFAGIALFSYTGMKDNDYFAPLKTVLQNETICYSNLCENAKQNFTNTIQTASNTILGTVYNEENQYLAKCLVTLVETKQTTYTDKQGFFIFSNLKPGFYTIHALSGNETKSYSVSFDTNQTNKIEDISFTFPVLSLVPKQTVQISAMSNKSMILLYWKNYISYPVTLYRKNNSNRFDKYSLYQVIADSLSYWIDYNVEPYNQYEYKIVDANGGDSATICTQLQLQTKINKVTIVKNYLDNQFELQLNLLQDQQIHWRIEDLKENLIASGTGIFHKGNNFVPCSLQLTSAIKSQGGILRFLYQSDDSPDGIELPLIIQSM